ncbi:MAG TPA: hypothetical protein VK619_14665 [Pyrinomonadaceae bacterium]|nr:hypothetical protein [Pyrinomonadaceae bacterium]
MKNLRALLIALIVAVAALIAISARAYYPETGGALPQDTVGLDSRIRALEQRLNFIESNMARLEQQSMLNSTRQPSSNRSELQFDLLQRQIGTLQIHINEIECGLARLDERTLSTSARAMRPRAERSNDPCRLNPDVPLQFPTSH